MPANTRAKRIGLWHGGGNYSVMLLFAASWWLRGLLPEPGGLPSLVLHWSGVALVSGWLGGELVDRLGVGVDEGANLNAPSSLSAGQGARPQAPQSGRRKAVIAMAIAKTISYLLKTHRRS